MNVRTMIQTRIQHLRAEEIILISKLQKEHQIVDAGALLEALHERNVLNKMLGDEYRKGWLNSKMLEMEAVN